MYGIGSSRSNRYEREQYQRYIQWVDRINAAIKRHNEAHPEAPRERIKPLGMGAWLARRYDAALSRLAQELGVKFQ